ncbi:hypothetical protein [Macrococcoides caseolyticum]|uniref:hypothetical protein n=1 Tax=Macrococcoides caseolyticum TaxID=69966 RepID=UPI001F1AAAD9|nr:hypothetical protein [Macrococcus caseolyticus]MCE4956517.1 hypothetical protein [Macrococcus caseolyticus]
MNEEEKISLLIDERTELIPHETIYDKASILSNEMIINDDIQTLIQQEKMTTEEILREIAEEEELESENKQAEEEVRLYKYIISMIEHYEGKTITIQQLRNMSAHSASQLTEEMLNEILSDYVEAGYIRIEEDKLYVTFLGSHVMTLL